MSSALAHLWPLGGHLPGAPASSPLAQRSLCPLTLAGDLVTGLPEPQAQDLDGRNLQMELIARVLVGGQLLWLHPCTSGCGAHA